MTPQKATSGYQPATVGFHTAEDWCKKCRKAMEDNDPNAEEICVKCQKALTKEKRINMSTLIDRIDKLLIGEMSVVGGSYIAGTTINVIGSQQTRAHGDYTQAIDIMQQKEPNNRNAVMFNKILGAFVPRKQQPDVDLEDGEHDYIK